VKAGFRTLVVPDDYPTISSAIGNATDGDVVLVKRGVYEEKPLEINKPLSIIGEDPNSTIIKVNAPITNMTQILSQIYITIADAIIINANGVKLSNLTIVTGGNIIAIGDRTQILANNIACGSTEKGLVINGSYCNITENIMQTRFTGGTVSSLINISGSFNTISKNSAYKIIITRDSNRISNNTIDSIQMSNANSNVIYGNNISTSTISTRTADYGVRIVDNSSHNIIYNNNILALLSGVEINSKSAENNTFYHNNFLIKYSNEPDRLYTYNLGLVNFWDNGEEGNYWEDYNGTDADRDGIGDTPYVIDGNNVDNYPLMFPYDIEDDTVVLPPPEPFPTALVTTVSVALVAVIGVGLLVYFKKRDQ
jgi:nitrous oxidase accessory protein NosD